MASNYDTPWKEAMGQYFQKFLQFFFPEIHDDVEWSAGYEFLDAELQAITRDAQHGRRFADRLVKLTRASGSYWTIQIGPARPPTPSPGSPPPNSRPKPPAANYKSEPRLRPDWSEDCTVAD